MQVLIIVIAFIYSHYISQFKSSIKSRYNQQSNCICTINVFIRSYHIYTDTDTNIDSSIDFQGAKNITYVCNQHIHIQKLNTISAYTHTIVCISRTQLNSITSSLAPNLSSCISLSIPPTPPSNTPSNLLPAQSNLLSAQSKLYSSNLSTQSNLLSASILICLCSLLCILCKQLLPLCHIMKILLFTLLLTMPIVNGTCDTNCEDCGMNIMACMNSTQDCGYKLQPGGGMVTAAGCYPRCECESEPGRTQPICDGQQQCECRGDLDSGDQTNNGSFCGADSSGNILCQWDAGGGMMSGHCEFLPSINPTLAPTHAPSISPTQPPSNASSISPSISPTQAPSLSPLLAPSLAPTQAPSVNPTVYPTQSPTIAPSISPTIAPSISPSIAPSISPSIAPSISPSIAPSI
eukprot:155190_1